MKSRNPLVKTKAEFYKIDVAKIGRPRKIKTAKAFADLFNDYIDHALKNPLMQQVAFHAKGIIKKTKLRKVNALTLEGFCLFADITLDTFSAMEKRGPEFLGVATHIRESVFQYQYVHAAADLLNSSIVARKLHLAERTISAGMTIDPKDVNADSVKKISEFLDSKY